MLFSQHLVNFAIGQMVSVEHLINNGVNLFMSTFEKLCAQSVESMGKWWLAPAAYLYKLGVTFRHRLFDWGVLRSETFPVPVICIGNITVGGVVEACTVEAGGDLVVSGGVQGDNQAVIRAQRNIFAKFIENSCVYVKDSLHADCLINCDVYCDGEVEVRSGRMTVIGGTLRAARSVSAGTVGSRAECRTEVFLGGQPCADFECHILHQEIGQLEKDLEKTERQPDSPAKLSSMSKMRMQLMINRKKLAQLDKERELAAGEQEEAEKPPLRLACSTVYPGTVLGINGVTHQFDRRYSPCTADLADGEIRLQ